MWERQKFPDLIGKTPKQQLERLPTQPKEYCGKRNKMCSIHGGGCGYRFKAGDKHWVCPKCGLDRRCGSRKLEGKKACRMHGGNAGRPRTKGYAILENLKGFNDLLKDERLLSNSQHIAALDSMSLDLVHEMTEHDHSALLDEAQKAARMVVDGLRYGNTARTQAGADMLLEALAPLRHARDLRREYYDIMNLRNRMVDSERKWMMESEQMIPVSHVYEFMTIFHQLAFQFIPTQNDRAAFARRLMAYFPAPQAENGKVATD
jgi:rubredoxin